MAITEISPISTGGVRDLLSTQPSSSSPVNQIGKSFSDMLDSLTQSENQSNDMVTQFSTGGNVDLHDLMIGLETTDIQFRVAMSIRDRLVDAYREVMRMQV